MIIQVFVLIIVFVLIAARQLSNKHLQLLQIKLLKTPVDKALGLEIWHIMLFGAVVVLLTGQISPVDAFHAINFDVIIFLFGMFVIGQAMEQSGYLSHLSYKLFSKAKTVNHLLLLLLFGLGIASAFLMNDTLAIIGTPVVLVLAAKNNIPPKILLLALAFSVTIGSVMSPIGNPQNLLIAINGNMSNPFGTFFYYLFLPTMICLFVAYFLLKFFYKDQLKNKPIRQEEGPIKNHRLASLSRFSLVIVILLIIVKIFVVVAAIPVDFRLTYISLLAALPIIIFSRKRPDILRNIDWKTIVFFIAMFVLMGSVWQSGFFQALIVSGHLSLLSIAVILLAGVLVSQFISNVPFVALYLPLLIHSGATGKELVALAAGGTLAGNLFILGAASNIIIIQNSEKRSKETLTFIDFAKIGIPMTIIDVIVYWFFLTIL
ncbi:MAG: SLC13 family permease [Candidatus Aenigmarchaeota archaeon]|nr:SLC13 family permease [Candidatus Aenigmarchaeota archaeon]